MLWEGSIVRRILLQIAPFDGLIEGTAQKGMNLLNDRDADFLLRICMSLENDGWFRLQAVIKSV